MVAIAVVLPLALAGHANSAAAASSAGAPAAKQPASRAAASKQAAPGQSASRQRASTRKASGQSAQRQTASVKQAARGTGRPAARKAGAKQSVGRTSSPKAAAPRLAADKSSARPHSARKAAAGRPVASQRRLADSGAAKRVVHTPAPRLSIGQAAGLHHVYDPLALHSNVALVLDAVSGRTLFEKNTRAVLPIASITKLMTAMVVLDAALPLDEVLRISEADIDTEKFTRSRLSPGTALTRREMLQLALMSSENRAANALGRHYPGGLDAFVATMNDKAHELGMTASRFVEPTGLSSSNVSNAVDLARLVSAASEYALIRDYSTASSLVVDAGPRAVSYRNTNRLVDRPDWEIGLQKTGYISEAGNCLVMRTLIDGRPIVLVLLDADGKLSRFGDAQRIRSWLESEPRPDGGMQRAFAQPSRGS